MTPWLALVAAGLWTAGLVDALKAHIRPRISPLAKIHIANALAGVFILSVYRHHLTQDYPYVVWAGAWGLSRVVHALVSTLQALKDRNRIEVATEVAKRRRTAPRR